MIDRKIGSPLLIALATCALSSGAAFADLPPNLNMIQSETARGPGGPGGGGHGGGGGNPGNGPGHGGGNPGNGPGHGGGNPGNGPGHGGGNPGNGPGHGGGNPGNGPGHGGGNPGNGPGHGGGNPGNGPGHGGGNPGNGPGHGGGNPGNGPGHGGGNPGNGPGHGGGNPGNGPGHGGGNPGNGPGHGGGNPGNGPGHGGGFPGNGPGHGGGGFPGNGPGHGGGHGNPGAPHYGHDGHGNIVSPGHDDRIHESDRRRDNRRNDDRIRRVVDRYGNDYRSGYRNVVVRNYDRFHGYRDSWGPRYRPWEQHGFCGGYHWEVRPYYDIDTYFYVPMIYWFYVGQYDDYYYRSWYGNDYDSYPDLQQPFTRVGTFYPTEDFRDLNLEVSNLDVSEQIGYRGAMTILSDRLADEVSSRSGWSTALGQGSVVIDHYQMLPYDSGVVVEGFVSQDGVQFPFKALLDLQYPVDTQVFIPSGYDASSAYDLDVLQQLNDRILDLGGEVEDGTQ